ncbi:MAG: lysophospholipid acyltransferase family protein [Clostridiaceae bacterium]
MASKSRQANRGFNKTVKFVIIKYLINKYNVEYHGLDFKEIKTPYLILCNHVNNLDPFFVGYYVDEPVHYVTSDEQFRSPIKKFFLNNLLGAIPKKKFVSDMATVRDIIKIKNNKGVVGIFPEGKRSWQGETEDVILSTDKLVKMLKIPVITFKIQGAHLTHPRWASKSRKGKIYLTSKISLNEEQLKNMSSDEIHEVLKKDLYHNETNFQEKNKIKYKGKKLAEHLELYLFTCPKCKSIGSLKSKHNKIYCKKCNYNLIINEYGSFEKNDNEVYFKYPGQWDKWQKKYLKNTILNKIKENRIIIEDNDIEVFVGSKLKPLKKIIVGNLVLMDDGLYVKGINNKVKICFEIKKISGLNVQYNSEFEFYYENKLYRFRFLIPRTSAYKWCTALNIMKNIKEF